MINVDSIDALIDLLLGDGAQRSDFVGCNDVEIEQIRVAQGIAMLPPSYEEFLKVMGHGEVGSS